MRTISLRLYLALSVRSAVVSLLHDLPVRISYANFLHTRARVSRECILRWANYSEGNDSRSRTSANLLTEETAQRAADVPILACQVRLLAHPVQRCLHIDQVQLIHLFSAVHSALRGKRVTVTTHDRA